VFVVAMLFGSWLQRALSRPAVREPTSQSV
jgi:hypothetical protein